MSLRDSITSRYLSSRARQSLIVDGSTAWVPIDHKLRRSPAAPRRAPRLPQDGFPRPTTPAEPKSVAPDPSGNAEGQAPASNEAHERVAPVPSTPSAPKALADHDYDDCVVTPRVKFKHIQGMKDTKRRIYNAARAILDRNTPNIDLRNGILLHGAPGNGKTLFAEALAGELEIPLIAISFGEIASKWINETPQKLRAVFNAARKTGRCVLLLDELDSILKRRDGGNELHSMDRDLVNTALKEIVSLRNSQVILVGATNYLDQLDSAGIREGRFDFKIEVPPPDFDARVWLIGWAVYKSLGEMPITRATAEALATRWGGFSVARIKALGAQIREMRDDDVFTGTVTFEIAMRAMRAIQGRRGTLPENVKPINSIVMPEKSRDTLRHLAYQMREEFRIAQLGGRLPRGLLFFGPPGTGKTQAAMALAKDADYGFLKTTGADLLSCPDAWEKLVREAKEIRPTIVFIDEADDILADRRSSNLASLTSKILATLDGAEGSYDGILYIAATNHPDRLDPAALRGQRFAQKIAFDVPGYSAMRKYIAAALARQVGQRFSFLGKAYDYCFDVLEGRSIADADAMITEVANRAAVRALQTDVYQIRPEDVMMAADMIL